MELWKDLSLKLIGKKGFKGCVMFSLPSVDPDLGY